MTRVASTSRQRAKEPRTAATAGVADGLRIRMGRSYRFEAAHFLPRLPEGHRCRNLHGHNYRVEIVVSGALDQRGFVWDFAELDAIVMPLGSTPHDAHVSLDRHGCSIVLLVNGRHRPCSA